jgi:hypothetical protein
MFTLTWGLRLGRMLAGRLPVPARTHRHAALHTCQGQRDRGEPAIDPQDEPSLGQPAAPWLTPLPHPVHPGLVPALAPLGCWPTPSPARRPSPCVPQAQELHMTPDPGRKQWRTGRQDQYDRC